MITVGTVYKGANVQDIEKTVTYPIEKAVCAVPGVHHVESRSRQGISVVQVWFNYDADLNAGQNEIIQRIQQIRNTLPSGIKQPFIIRVDLSNIPVCLLTVSGGGFDERQLYDLAYNTIEPQIERLTGVASANVDGGKIRQITVNLNRDLLYAKGISVLEVARAVNDSNFLLPSGDIKLGTIDYNVFTNNQFQSSSPWRTSSSARWATCPSGSATSAASRTPRRQQTSVVRVNGERAVYLRVNKQPGANTIEVVDARPGARCPSSLGVPPGVKVGLTFDQSTYIRQSIESLWHEAVHRRRPRLPGHPASSCARSSRRSSSPSPSRSRSCCTLVAMYFLGQTLNIFTLGGLALAVGRLVDDSIVELENINRHLAMPGKPRARPCSTPPARWRCPSSSPPSPPSWSSCRRSSWRARRKLLFIPLTFTISFSLFASFLVSRTVTPLLCLHWLKPQADRDAAQPVLRDRLMAWSQALLDGSTSAYQRALGWALGHRKTLIARRARRLPGEPRRWCP